MPKVHRAFAGIAAALFAVVLSACSGGGGGGAVATVNGQTITHAQLDQKLEAGPAARSQLQQMVTYALIDQYAQSHGLSASPAEVSKLEDTYKQNMQPGQWDQMLKARGLTEDDVAKLLSRQIIINKAVGGNIHITDKQIADYFKKNHAQFDTPAEAKARHILVSDLKTADKVEADLKNGADFATEAEKYSNDPGSKSKGGELGWFRMGQMVPSFEKWAFNGPIGKISPPVKSPFGYHIIQVEARKPAVKATLASTHDRIADALKQQQESPLIPGFLQQLQAQAKITINDPQFDGLFPSPAPIVTPVPATAAPVKASAAPAKPAVAPSKK